MDFDFGYGTAKFCLKPVPTVFITFVNLPGVHAFAASDVIDAAKRSRSFGVAPLWNDQPFMSINADKLKEVAQWIESQTTGKGRFIAKVSGAGTASAGLPGYAAGDNGERK